MPPHHLATESHAAGAMRASRLRGAAALIGCASVAALTWLTLLPYVGQLPVVRTMIDRNDALGVDPSAKFYSEVPAMPRIIDQVRDARRNGER